ncbi:CaiB/BaiF CoA transferase family protein [Brevibacillus centrosporus]|uniref:Crotonobetainyl-CoA:carnitine CoA-transferase CaiB n=1 Tax=Brevibacillus centrosporus TaxID=54910 RepID=A0A1I3KZ91_9BACL|nr:CaiB/BaiF CoA-transferase family protein [Brevibacillus centrosporus]MEC2129815.1 CaiB/BaiF CoA-transferase family protein [Brevibacillus centrosporus]RNB71762.1 CoA transferase [Brevibacillus centrosporus]GED31984.1 CoA transferase [Brevibacillus centrosporus]SFI77694.1 Crotonobetainyl-CoA:carnitine CoA-transferase CaiB [Brevibacillus centrosporus]
MRPLDGITVVALEQAVAAPFATRQLAELGARVIKIERPKVGDFARHYDTTVNGMSSHFVWCNHSKESLTLNVKEPEAKEILDQLLAKADVFIQNFGPGAIDRLGFGIDVLKEKYPQLIICSISGYGENGPYREKKAYDLLVQCEAGLVSVTGSEEVPSKVGISVADIAAGMYAYSGILSALIARSRTGKGSVLEISMLEALGEWMGFPLYYTNYSGNEPKRNGASHATIYPYGPFRTGNDKTVFLAIQNEREWEMFCNQVLQQPGRSDDARFATNSDRLQNKAVLQGIIDEVFLQLTAEEVIARLEQAKIANARLNTVQDFWEHPQLKARNRWRQVETPAGPVQSLLPPVTMEGVEPCMGPIPALGQHNEKILLECGFDAQTIRKWQEAGVV